jgi:hypothetical protein
VNFLIWLMPAGGHIMQQATSRPMSATTLCAGRNVAAGWS